MLIVCPWLLFKGFNAVTLYPFVVLRESHSKYNIQLLNHERIHLRQQIELLIIPFYIIYLLEYLIKVFKYKNRYLAYRNISFEREAYTNETNNDYLTSRTLWAFFKYF